MHHETPPTTRRVDVIVNQSSGAPGKEAMMGRVVEDLTSRGVRVRLLPVQHGAALIPTATQAAEGDADLVVAGGGDGTVAAVAHALVGRHKPLGVLPLGTFNYFARNLGIPLELDAALDVIAAGAYATASVGVVNDHIFLNNASIGLYPTVLEHRETAYRQLGRSRMIAYASVALALIQPPMLMNLHLIADGASISRRTPLLFVGTNACQLRTFAIAGPECLDGGRMALYITRPVGALTLWRLALRAVARGLYGSREFELVCAREVSVSLRPRHVRVALDGEVAVLDTPLRFGLRPDALRVVVPVRRDPADPA
jgi:diacylglycerol kinase family enzyme